MEIERKFLPTQGYDILGLLYSDSMVIEDIYLSDNLRLRHKNEDWIITYKNGFGISREEVEFKITCTPQFESIPKLSKVRRIIPYLGQKFEINIFKDILFKDDPLILIELELEKDDQNINKPEWLGEEVTDNELFYGYNLAKFLRYTDFSIIR